MGHRDDIVFARLQHSTISGVVGTGSDLKMSAGTLLYLANSYQRSPKAPTENTAAFSCAAADRAFHQAGPG